MSKNETIKRIKTALKRRTGWAWSVTGGHGTAWGWITINALPARCTMKYRLKEGATNNNPESWEEYDSHSPGGYMTSQDREILQKTLGLSRSVHHQGEKIPASYTYWQEYIDRAEGRTPSVIGEPYWD